MESTIRGTTMPVLEVHLDPGESVVAEAGRLGWFTETVELETTSALAGGDGLWDATKRSVGGGTFWMTRYTASAAPGTVAFPARLPGRIFELPLGPDRSYLIQRHGFLAGTEGAELTTAFDRTKLGAGLLGSFGFLLQRLEGTGHGWVELAGELTEYDLQAGQRLRVHPFHVGVVGSSVEYELTMVPGLKNKVLGGDGLFLLDLVGPGRVWLQSLSLHALAGALTPVAAHEDAKSQLEVDGIEAAAGAIGKLLF